MRQVDINEAKTQLSRFVDDAAGGEEIIIAKAGKPIARLIGIASQPDRRVPGALRDNISICDDFDAPLPEELERLFDAGQ